MGKLQHFLLWLFCGDIKEQGQLKSSSPAAGTDSTPCSDCSSDTMAGAGIKIGLLKDSITFPWHFSPWLLNRNIEILHLFCYTRRSKSGPYCFGHLCVFVIYWSPLLLSACCHKASLLLGCYVGGDTQWLAALLSVNDKHTHGWTRRRRKETTIQPTANKWYKTVLLHALYQMYDIILL